MNAREIPEFCPKWWSSGKPDDVKGQDLKKALTEAQQALALADKKGDADAIDSCLDTLKSLGSVVDKTIKKECDKKKHKDLIAVLEKFDGLISKETKRLEEIKASLAESEKEEDEDEQSKGKLFELDYLIKMIKLLKSGSELKFSFGLDKGAPENSCLLLCRKREPDRLLKILRSKSDFSKRLMTCGFATSDGKILQFRLADNAKEPSQICKLARVYLKKNPDLRFKKLRVVCSGGESFELDFEGDETSAPQVAGASGGTLQERLQKAATAAQTWQKSRDRVVDQISQLQSKLDAFNDDDVKAVRDRLSTVLERYPKLDFSGVTSATDKAGYEQGLAQTRRGIEEWKSVLAKDLALSTIDKNPFVKVNVADTFKDALSQIEGQLNIA